MNQRPNSAFTFDQNYIRGHFKELVDRYSDLLRKKSRSRRKSAFLISALCFLGRLQEANSLFKKYSAELSADELAFCFFSLIVGNTRISNFNLAEKWIDDFPIPDSDLQNFFFHQSQSFYFFFRGQINDCKNHAEKSFDAAIASGELYPQALAMDILGHVRVRQGQIQTGFQLMAEAIHLAQKMKNFTLTTAFEVALLQYKCNYHGSFKQNFLDLQRTFNQLQVTDSYSRSLLGLELSRQLTLRGAFRKSEEVLQEISSQILGSNNLRYEILFNLRFAELHYQKGDYSSAEQNLRAAERCSAIESTDFAKAAILGMSYKLASRKKSSLPPIESLRAELTALAVSRPSPQSTNWLARTWKNTEGNRQDEFYLLLSQSMNPSGSGFQKLYDLGFLPLVCQRLNISSYARVLFLKPHLGILIFKAPERILDLRKLGKNSISILQTLTLGPASKESLCEKVWKFTYDPLRHDRMIYAAIGNLRNQLQELGPYIETTETGYQLSSQVAVHGASTTSPKAIRNTEPKAITKSEPMKIPNPGPNPTFNSEKSKIPPGKSVQNNTDPFEMTNPPIEKSDLNWRQIQGLALFNDHSWIDVKFYSQTLHVSSQMASRDLSYLYSQKYLSRFGFGRATKYKLR